MNSESDLMKELAAVLREVGASPKVSPQRIVHSTLYDLDYHVALIACVFFTITNDQLIPSHRIVAHWLKILQFVAVRPTLLDDFKIWAGSRRQPNLDSWQKMPRGYLGDNVHDRTVELLVAGGVLIREGDELVAGSHFSVLRKIYIELLERNLFQSERSILLDLSKFRVNKTMLRGA